MGECDFQDNIFSFGELTYQHQIFFDVIWGTDRAVTLDTSILFSIRYEMDFSLYAYER